MSAIHLHETLTNLVEIHGSIAVLEALRDACHLAADYTSDTGRRNGSASELWTKAGDALGFAMGDVSRAESRSDIDMSSALDVLAGIAADGDGVAA